MIGRGRHNILYRSCLGVIVLVYGLLVVMYAVEVPRWNAADEPAHFNYVRDLAERRQLPVLQVGDFDQATILRLTSARFPDGTSVDSLRYEGHQPPLYYALAAPLYLVASGLRWDSVVVLRLFSGLLGFLVVMFGYAIARRVFVTRSWLALVVAGFLAFLPMHLAVNAAIGNDPLANLIMAVIVWESIGLLKSRAPRRAALFRLVFWLALALLTKTTAYVGVGVAGAAILTGAAIAGEWRRGLTRLVAVWIGGLVLAGWWFVRNVAEYGLSDPFGLSRHALVARAGGQPLTGQVDLTVLKFMVGTTFTSFWGKFGWMSILLDARIYDALAGLCIVALLGLVLLAKERRSPNAIVSAKVALLALVVILVALATLQYNFSSFLQPQGRYLFPALPPLAIAFAAGLSAVASKRHAPVLLGMFIVALAVLDWVALFRYILPALRV